MIYFICFVLFYGHYTIIHFHLHSNDNGNNLLLLFSFLLIYCFIKTILTLIGIGFRYPV